MSLGRRVVLADEASAEGDELVGGPQAGLPVRSRGEEDGHGAGLVVGAPRVMSTVREYISTVTVMSSTWYQVPM